MGQRTRRTLLLATPTKTKSIGLFGASQVLPSTWLGPLEVGSLVAFVSLKLPRVRSRRSCISFSTWDKLSRLAMRLIGNAVAPSLFPQRPRL